ncbi:MAG: AAA family ATPase [Oligosphaeraceae bacterium]
MGHLRSITIRGFKSLRQVERFELRDLNVLVGANGAGKSNFIEAFRILSAMMRTGGLREYVAGAADAFFYGGLKRTSRIEMSLDFGQQGYDFDVTPTEDGFLLISHEKSYCPGCESLTRNFTSGTYDAALPADTHSDLSAAICEAIRDWAFYHFHDTGKLAGMRRYCDVNHNARLADDARNIAAFLYRLGREHEREYQHILDVVRLAVPFFKDFSLKPNDDEYIRLAWLQRGLSDYPMRPTQLSDGSIRFICLATALLQPDLPSAIILDEPELGLHPEALHILAELINLASRRTQVIVATQSSQLLDNFSFEDMVIVRRAHGETCFERLKEDDYKVWLDEFSIGELWTHDMLQGGTNYE